MWCESHLQVIIRQLARTRLLAKSLTRKFMVKGFLPYSVELLHSNDLKTRMIGCCMTACDVNSPSQVCKLLCMVERILLHCFCVFTSIVAACGGISGVFCQSALPSKPKVRTHIRHAIFTFAGACCLYCAQYVKQCPDADRIADMSVMLMVQLLCLTCDMFDLSPFRLQVKIQNSCAEEAVRLLGAIHRELGCPRLMVYLEAATGAQTFVVDVFLKHVYPFMTDGSAQPHQRAGALHCLLTGATAVVSQ